MSIEYLSSFYDNTIELLRVMLERYHQQELQAVRDGTSTKTASLNTMKQFISHRYLLKTKIELQVDSYFKQVLHIIMVDKKGGVTDNEKEFLKISKVYFELHVGQDGKVRCDLKDLESSGASVIN